MGYKLNKNQKTLIKVGLNSEELIVPDTVTYISLHYNDKHYKMSDCKKLKRVFLSNSMQKIPPKLFKNSISLTQIEIPKSINYIEKNAFENCKNLKKIKIENLECKFSVYSIFNNTPYEKIYKKFYEIRSVWDLNNPEFISFCNDVYDDLDNIFKYVNTENCILTAEDVEDLIKDKEEYNGFVTGNVNYGI